MTSTYRPVSDRCSWHELFCTLSPPRHGTVLTNTNPKKGRLLLTDNYTVNS